MTRFDGDAHISPYPATSKPRRFRVWIEAPNFTGEVYVTVAKAKQIRDSLNHYLPKAQK